jgi:pre-mRNA-splicing factor SYF1
LLTSWARRTLINNKHSRSFQCSEREPDLPAEIIALLGPLATPLARKYLQRLTYIYEAALVQFSGSFKLWKSYLQMRMSYVLGKLVMKKKSGGKKRFPDMKDALEEERGELEQWKGGLDGIVSWEEWKALVATFERALMWLPKVRRTKLSRYVR